MHKLNFNLRLCKVVMDSIIYIKKCLMEFFITGFK
jgi:hypothetical protein